MDPNNVLPEQLADENYIERLFPKCSPKYTNERSQYRPSNSTSQSRRQNRAKVHQHSRKELEARRNKRRNMADDLEPSSMSGKVGAALSNINHDPSNISAAASRTGSASNSSTLTSNENMRNKISSTRVSAAPNHRPSLRTTISSDSTDDEIGGLGSMRKSKLMGMCAQRSKSQVLNDSSQQTSTSPLSSSSKLKASGKRRPGKYVASQNLLQQLQRSQSGGTYCNEQNTSNQSASTQENTVGKQTNKDLKELAGSSGLAERSNQSAEIGYLSGGCANRTAELKHQKSNARNQQPTLNTNRNRSSEQMDVEPKASDPSVMSKQHQQQQQHQSEAQPAVADRLEGGGPTMSRVAQSSQLTSPQVEAQSGLANFSDDKTNTIEGTAVSAKSSCSKLKKDDSINPITTATRSTTDMAAAGESQSSSVDGRGFGGSCLANTQAMCLNTNSSQEDDGKYINLFVYDNNIPATKIERKMRDTACGIAPAQSQPDSACLSAVSSAALPTSTLPVNVTTSSSTTKDNERQPQQHQRASSRNIDQDDGDDSSYPNLISIERHHPSHRLLTADLNEDEHDRDSGNIVSNDASTEELCGSEDLVESVDLRKRISAASGRDKCQLNSADQAPSASNSSSPSASNISTPTMSPKRRFSADVACPQAPLSGLSSSPRQQAHLLAYHHSRDPHPHHHRSSLTGITTLQTVDEKAEINNDEVEANESKVKRELVSKSIDDIRVTTDEFSSDNSNGRQTNPPEAGQVHHNQIRKAPGFPHRIKPLHQAPQGACSNSGGPSRPVAGEPADKPSDESNGSEVAPSTQKSMARIKQDTQLDQQSPMQTQRRSSLQKAERQVRFELPATSGAKQGDNKSSLAESQVHQQQNSLPASSNQQHCVEQSTPSAFGDPATNTTTSRSTNNNARQLHRSELEHMRWPIEGQREMGSNFEHDNVVVHSSRANHAEDDYVDITDKSLSVAIDKVSLSARGSGDGGIITQPFSSRDQIIAATTAETTTLQTLDARSNFVDESHSSKTIESLANVSTESEQIETRQQAQNATETQVTTARYHKLPNESSHYSIVRSNNYQTVPSLMSSPGASTSIINTKPPPISNPLPPKSASLQFNNLSDADSGSDNEPRLPLPNTVHNPPQGATSGSKEIVPMPMNDASKLADMEVVARANSHPSNSLPLNSNNSSNNNNNNNSSNTNNINLNDDDQTPTTKTALIFPRLDEGLSSEAESADDGGSDGDDEQAMEADVDADDDEDDEDDEDDDDMDDDLDNTTSMSVIEREAHPASVQSSLDCYVRGNSAQQQSQKPITRALSALQQQQQQHSQTSAMVSMANQNEHNSDIQQQQQQHQHQHLHPHQHSQQHQHQHQQQQVTARSQCSSYNCVNQNSLDQTDIKSVTSFSNQNGGGQTNYWMAVPNQQSSLSAQTAQSHVYGNQRQQSSNQSAIGNNVQAQFKGNNTAFNRDEASKVPSRLSSDTDNETDRLLGSQRSEQMNKMSAGANPSNSTDIQPISSFKQQGSSSREVLIEGVLFNVKYLGSTHTDCEGRGEKEDRIHQAEMAVHEVKIRNGDTQSAIDVQLFISTEKIMVLDDKHRKIMMDHSLRTISYIADIGDAIVLIVRKKSTNSDATNELGRSMSRISCHVFESSESHTITKSISQAFQVAYTELLKANGAGDASSYLPKELDYQEVLNSQEMSTDELEMFARKENQHEVIVPKKTGEILGVSIVESGWGSVLPTVVIASIKQDGPAYRCKKLSVGDQILSINGISLVGLPLAECQEILRKTRKQTVARLSVVPCPITVEVKIKRPDTKYQLGFSVQNGVICSLLRGGIAERGGVRVGHRIMSINGTTVVGVPHEKIVTLLASSVGEIRMKTCLTSLYRLILGEENPVHF